MILTPSQKIELQQKVKNLLAQDNSGHGWAHVERVCLNALRLCEKENGDKDIVLLAALLHDCDDYKLFGKEAAENLTNTKKIMQECSLDLTLQNAILEIVRNLGYSKYLSGTQKLNKNGKIVQDADMLDALGAIGIIRTLVFNATKGSGIVFQPDIFPREKLTCSAYQDKSAHQETAINHLFEKILKLKNIMYTKSGYDEACLRFETVVAFLRAFFREQGLQNWLDYLNAYLEALSSK